MRKSLYAGVIAVFALGAYSHAQTGLTTITASHISVGGKPITAGKVLLTPVGTDGKPIAFVSGAGGGLNAPVAFSCNIVAGAIVNTCQVPDAALTTPTNLLYTIDVTATAGYLTFRLPTVANITGPTWALDAYAPPSGTTNSQTVQITYGATAAPNPCATPSFYYQTSVGLSVCVGGVPVAVGGGSVTAAAMVSALAGRTGCTTAGNAWNPATDTCTPSSGGAVNTVGVADANGVSGTSSGGADPQLTLELDDITPKSVTVTDSTKPTQTNFTPTTHATLVKAGAASIGVDAVDVANVTLLPRAPGSGNVMGTNNAGKVQLSYTPCPLQNATNICITQAPYSADPTGVVDATNAFNAAITALASSGGTIWVPDGTYNLDGPLLDTGGANAILPMPKIQSNIQPFVLIQIKGLSKPTWGTSTGAILQTAATTGNLIGGFNNTSPAGGTYPPFTNVGLTLDNLTFIAPTNPGIVVVNASRLTKLGATHLIISTVAGTVPSNTAGAGIIMPALANNVENYIDDVNIYGFYKGYVIGEHTHIGAGYAGNDVNGFVFDVGSTAAVGSHHNSNSISADYLWCQGCTNVIAAGAEITTLHVSEVDMEVTTGFGINDPSNLLRGLINFNVTVPFDSTSYCNANPMGALFVTLTPMQCQGGVAFDGPEGGGFGYAVKFFRGGTDSAPNAWVSNPSAGVISLDGTTKGDGQGILHALLGVFSGSVTGGAVSSFQNTNNCVGCYTGFQLKSDSGSGNFFGFYSLPSNWTSITAVLHALEAYLGASANNTAGLYINTEGPAPVVIATNNVVRQTTNPDGSITYWYSTTPTGSCANNGSWAFSQDKHISMCLSGTWSLVI